MDYEIVTRKEIQVAGPKVRASNTPEGMAKIAGVWNTFFSAAIQEIPHRVGETVYGVYTRYENGAAGEYDMLACCEVDGAQGLAQSYECITLPAGRYAKFAFRGDVRRDTGRFWGIVWNTPLDRKFTCDFEEYPPCADCTDAPIILWIALRD